MTPSLHLAAIKKARARDWVLRFLFGGAISAGTGLISHFWGPGVGGLFLAFPAILPATLTLARSRDGRAAATADARGGSLGALGLIAFAGTATWLLACVHPALALSGALLAWMLASVVLWWTVFG